VNVGATREVEWNGRHVRTGIWKAPVQGHAVAVRGVNLDGDDQADRVNHGGVDKAVYAYAIEDYHYWSEHEQLDVHPALFGENLTVKGIDLNSCLVGERWQVGTTTLEVAQPRLPCFKLGIRVGDSHFPRRFQHVGRLGAYLRIVQEGAISTGDEIRVISRPTHTVTLATMAHALEDRTTAGALLAAGYLPPFWKRVAEQGDDY
jgi:MOSC domain-containing protein YiiM